MPLGRLHLTRVMPQRRICQAAESATFPPLNHRADSAPGSRFPLFRKDTLVMASRKLDGKTLVTIVVVSALVNVALSRVGSVARAAK